MTLNISPPSWLSETLILLREKENYFKQEYISWALIINGLHVAEKRYNEKPPCAAFEIKSFRNKSSIASYEQIALFPVELIGQMHREALPNAYRYGFVDLFQKLESFIFELYRTYYWKCPDSLLQGKEYRHLCNLYKNQENSPEDKEIWEREFSVRLNNWQRKKSYNGIGDILLAYLNAIDLKPSPRYKLTNANTWAESLKILSCVRNHIVHRSEYADKELADLCCKPHSNGFVFKEGDKIELKLEELMAIECFAHDLIRALRFSLLDQYFPNWIHL